MADIDESPFDVEKTPLVAKFLASTLPPLLVREVDWSTLRREPASELVYSAQRWRGGRISIDLMALAPCLILGGCRSSNRFVQ